MAVRRRPLIPIGTQIAKRCSQRIRQRIPEGQIAVSLADPVQLAEILNADCDLAHGSHHIGKGFTHPVKIVETAYKDPQNDRC